ncbi:hypothetical protein [Actinophytocola sp.]|uniref:hypothetical protein n=1 Tax=Actinophytocola sp. TaxID=1872138 RepID=UPI00389AC911
MLLTMAGRLDDDALADARQMLASAELDRSLEFLAGCLVAGRVVLSHEQHAELATLFGDMYLEQDLIDRIMVTDRLIAGRHRFAFGAVEGLDPVRGVADAVRPVLGVLPDIRSMWCVWRLTPAGPASGPVPHRMVLVGIGPGGFAPATAYRVEDALRRAGIRASVEVLMDGVEPGEYHREAMRSARQIPFDGPGFNRPRVEPAYQAARIEPARVEPPRMAPPPEPPRLEPARAAAVQPEPARAEPVRVESTRIESPRVDSSRVDSSRVESPRLESPRVESPRVESPRVEPARGEPEPPRPEVSRAEVPRAEVSRAEVSRAEVPRGEVPRGEVSRVETPEPVRHEGPRMSVVRDLPPAVDAPRIDTADLPVRKAPNFSDDTSSHIDPPTMVTPALGGVVGPGGLVGGPTSDEEPPPPVEAPRVDAARTDPFQAEPFQAEPFQAEPLPVRPVEPAPDEPPGMREEGPRPTPLPRRREEPSESSSRPRLAPAPVPAGGVDKHSQAFVDDILNTQERNLLKELQDELARREQQDPGQQQGQGSWRVDRSGGRHGKPATAGPFDQPNQSGGPVIINGVPPHDRGHPPNN